ncbi:MAG: hypothetical protein R3353_03450 [Salegentibacter mishustinae]|nr:hypothetical protein [Salegentibacter mishustinae]
MRLKRKIYKDTIPLNILLGCIIYGNFKSLKRTLIFIFHFCSIIDLREKKSSKYSGIELAKAYQKCNNEKVEKEDLYNLFNLSKNTFRKNFEEYLVENNYGGRKSFTIIEAYGLLELWQGEAQWIQWEAISKKELTEILNLPPKMLSMDLKKFLANNGYKNRNKLSPSLIVQFLDHIDFDKKSLNEII